MVVSETMMILEKIYDRMQEVSEKILLTKHMPLNYSFSKTFKITSTETRIDFDSETAFYENKRKTPVRILGISVIPKTANKTLLGLIVTIQNVPIIEVETGALENTNNLLTNYLNGRILQRDEKIKFFLTTSDSTKQVEATVNVEVGDY